MTIYYRLIPHNPSAHIYRVECTVPQPSAAGQIFTLPTWIPGSYMIRDFAKNIVTVSARNAQGDVAIKKLDKTTWQCDACVGELTICYDVYAWDLSVRAAHLDQTHAYFNGSSVFMAVVGFEDQPCTVLLEKPLGDVYKNWRVATGLSLHTAARYGFGEYQAANYDELIDCPVEMGDFTLLEFNACGVKHDVAITGRVRLDEKRLCADLQKICETQIRFFGEPAPFAYYIFLVMAVGEGYGGLEHRNSTSLLCSRDDLPHPHDKQMTDTYRNFLGLCSHEYFHTWNVKRIKPQKFIPYDLTKEVHTELLWAFEGITSYYDELMLYRAGVIDQTSYLQMLAQTITRVWRGLGRFKQTVTQSSFDAWTKLYKADENASNAIVNYYTKGACVALALDLTLRQKTHNQVSLDTVMRYLCQQYGQPGVGVAETEIKTICEQLSGHDLAAFFEQTLYSTEELSLEPLLQAAGVQMVLRPSESFADKGGKPSAQSLADLEQRADLGVRVSGQGDGVLINSVIENGAAQQAGLSANDVMVAINGLKVTAANMEKRLSRYRVGETVEIHAFRRDELLVVEAMLQAPLMDTCELMAIPGEPSIAWL